ncbi:MAG TPA: tetratricopeptide repeat protein [Bacteroidales bacterium]|jgi:tetratricopeptide (TPR) repeat protein|nr:tetratricopeptide repeat protein [Bacteroidales bacterium]
MKKHLHEGDWKFLIKLIVLCTLIIGPFSAFAQTATIESQYKEHVKKGDTYLAAKNYAAAMFEYEKASDLMPDEDEPKLKMQSIEATLGINELAEVKRKVELARQQEKEQLRKDAAKATQPGQPETVVATTETQLVQTASDKESMRRSILDSFAEELRQAEKGSDLNARSAVYRKIAEAFKKANDDEMAIQWLNKALAIEENLGKETEAAEVYEQLADSYYNSGDFQSSIENFERSLTLKEKAGDKAGASNVMSEIAGVYEATYDYKNAIEFYQQSAKVKESIQDESGLKDIENNLGDVYYKQKVLTSSIMRYEKAVDIIRKLDMDEALGSVYNKLGVAHYEMGNYDEAEKFFKESMKNLNENGNRKEASMALNNLGNLLFINNDYTEAIEYYERSLNTKKEARYDYGQAVTLFNLGNAYRRSGNQDMAIKSYEKSRRIADSLNISLLSSKNMKALAVSYNASKNFEKASELEEELSSKNMANVSIEIPVSENEMDLEFDKTQKILTKLNEEALKRKESLESGAENKMTDMYINNINSQYLREQSRNRMLIILSAALGTLLLGTLFLYYRNKKK